MQTVNADPYIQNKIDVMMQKIVLQRNKRA